MMKMNIALFILRVAPASMMLFLHGLPKISGYGQIVSAFPDPTGLGSSVALVLAIFTEVFCSIGVLLGIFTRFSSLLLFLTMIIAALIVHAMDPIGRKEFALLYAIPFLVISLIGPGKYSVDGMRGKQ